MHAVEHMLAMDACLVVDRGGILHGRTEFVGSARVAMFSGGYGVRAQA
jgi:hypothetical protein